MAVVAVQHYPLCPGYADRKYSPWNAHWGHLYCAVYTGYGPWRKYWLRCWGCDFKKLIGRRDPRSLWSAEGGVDPAYYELAELQSPGARLLSWLVSFPSSWSQKGWTEDEMDSFSQQRQSRSFFRDLY